MTVSRDAAAWMNLRRLSNNSLIKLGKELGRGGEGAVYPVIRVRIWSRRST